MKITSISTRMSDVRTIHDKCFVNYKCIFESHSMMEEGMGNECNFDGIIRYNNTEENIFQFFSYQAKGNLYFCDQIRLLWPGHTIRISGLATILLRANILMFQEQHFYQSYPTIIYWNLFSRSLNLWDFVLLKVCSMAFNHDFFFEM